MSNMYFYNLSLLHCQLSRKEDKRDKTRRFCVVFIVASSVSDEYHYAVMNIMNLIIVLELGPFSFCGVTEAHLLSTNS